VSSNSLLTIGYSTLAEREQNIKFLNSFQNLVIVQGSTTVATTQPTKQYKRIELPNRGVAKSRNAAISNAETKYLLFGDDDIIFNEDSINSAISYLESHPEISMLLLQAVDENSALRKRYPTKAHSLKLTNSAKAATYEMIIRVADFKSKSIYFDENFGAGAKNYLGDEYILIADALRAGLKGQFLPIIIATHPVESSGNVRNTKSDALARSKIFSRVFGIWAPLMRLLFLLKPPAKRFGFLLTLRFIVGR
jgi:glycosyltransferase involved in cell wall biosynthesis